MNPDTNRFEPLTKKKPERRDPGSNQTAEMQRRLRQQQKVKLDTLRDKMAPLTPGTMVRPNGSTVPKHWSVFTVGEDVVIKDYTFRVAYIGETAILFEPVGPVVVGKKGATDV